VPQIFIQIIRGGYRDYSEKGQKKYENNQTLGASATMIIRASHRCFIQPCGLYSSEGDWKWLGAPEFPAG
jgi:hypothetical protein